MKKILAFAGSNSSTSVNQKLINYVATLTEGVTIINLNDFDVPIYSSDLEKEHGVPQKIQELHAILMEYNNIIMACPEHNGLPPAFFKNILDWLSRAKGEKFLKDKNVLLLSTSPGGYGGQNNLKNLSNIMPYWGANILGTYSLPKFHKNMDLENNSIKNDEERSKLKATLEQLELSMTKA